jgi:hypothetical protein
VLIVARLTRCQKRQKLPMKRLALLHLRVVTTGLEEMQLCLWNDTMVVPIDADGRGPPDLVARPNCQKIALLVKNLEAGVAAVSDIDLPSPINGNAMRQIAPFSGCTQSANGY